MPRAKSFDEEEVLDRAVELFWETGYEGTSMQDLVDHLGISRSSLYNTFGDKHDLYARALDRYRSRYGYDLRTALASGATVRNGIQNAFQKVVERTLRDADRRGCFAVNATVERAPCDQDTARRAQENLTAVHETFHEALERGQATGELRPDLDTAAAARTLATTYYGMHVVAKAGPSRDELEDVVRTVATWLE